MKRRQAVEAMIEKTSKELARIEAPYPEALQKLRTDMDMNILIIDCLLHSRQALDYIAGDIYEVTHRRPPKRSHFPFANRTHTRRTFATKLHEWFPSLRATKPNLFDYLLDIQQYGPNGWLHDFTDISNFGKHDNIHGHNFRASLVLAGIQMEPGSSFGVVGTGKLRVETDQGTFMISGPRTITASNPAELPSQVASLAQEGIQAQVVEWFDFRIGSGTIGVLDMLERVEDFVADVYSRVKAML